MTDCVYVLIILGAPQSDVSNKSPKRRIPKSKIQKNNCRKESNLYRLGEHV